MAKLQLAIDDLSRDEAFSLLLQIQEYVDIIELGTPFIMTYGMEGVRHFRKHFPHHEILADLKIMDAGYYEAQLAFEAGADYITVLGITDLLTLKACQEAATKYRKRVYVDMMCVENPSKRVKEIEELDIYGISVHIGVDQQAVGKQPIDALNFIMKQRTSAILSVAGGISSGTVQMYVDAGADVVISGAGICHCDHPLKEAESISKLLRQPICSKEASHE